MINLQKFLAELHQERDNIDAAILVVSRLSSGAPRRGRPPKILTGNRFIPTEEFKTKLASISAPRRKFSAATRKKMAAAQKKRWAAKVAA